MYPLRIFPRYWTITSSRRVVNFSQFFGYRATSNPTKPSSISINPSNSLAMNRTNSFLKLKLERENVLVQWNACLRESTSLITRSSSRQSVQPLPRGQLAPLSGGSRPLPVVIVVSDRCNNLARFTNVSDNRLDGSVRGPGFTWSEGGRESMVDEKRKGGKRGLWCRSEQINGPGEFLVVCTRERLSSSSFPVCVRAPSARRSCVNQK